MLPPNIYCGQTSELPVSNPSVVAVHANIQVDSQDLIYTHTKNLRDACTYISTMTSWYYITQKEIISSKSINHNKQFVNRPVVYELVIHLLNWLAYFQLQKVKRSYLETRPNCLKADLMNRNDLQKHTSNFVLQARPNQHQCESDTENDLCWRCLDFACETNK